MLPMIMSMGKRIHIMMLIVALVLVAGEVSAAQSAAQAFQQANKSYIELSRDAKQRTQRTRWLRVIRSYHRVSTDYAKSPFAPRAMYKEGKLYEQLYGYSGNKADLRKAAATFERIAKHYPQSNLADDGLYRAARLYQNKLGQKQHAYDIYRRIITQYPQGDMAQHAREGLNSYHVAAVKKDRSPPMGKLALVKNVRQWSDTDYSRVVIDLERDVSFKTFVLPPNKGAGRPYRLVVDLDGSRTRPGQVYKLKVNDGILSSVRVCQNDKDKVRLVLDLTGKPSYNAFPLANPARLVVDVSTTKTIVPTRKPSSNKDNGIHKVRSGSPAKVPTNVPSLARQLALKVSTIVIDPGHGGKDPGAIGPGGVYEKDLVLILARDLATRLRKDGYTVYLTRDKDVFIPLEERTAFANRKKADLFISIHLNANSKTSVRGIETYFLNLTTDASAIQVAARENATTSKSLGDLQLILNDLMLNSKINESSRFATGMQQNVMSSVKGVGYAGRDLGVKQAPFYVLLGAQMPSVLVELGFITNKNDLALLKKPSYRRSLVEGVAKGVDDYANGTTYAYHGGTK